MLRHGREVSLAHQAVALVGAGVRNCAATTTLRRATATNRGGPVAQNGHVSHTLDIAPDEFDGDRKKPRLFVAQFEN